MIDHALIDTGAMLGHLLAIPIILDTNTSAAFLVKQWARNFHYGHLIMPPMAIFTCAVHARTAWKRRSAGLDWTGYLMASLITVAIIPFTLIFMATTNDALFGLNAVFDSGKHAVEDRSTMALARGLVARWGYLHFCRAVMPVTAAFLGLRTLLSEAARTDGAPQRIPSDAKSESM